MSSNFNPVLAAGMQPVEALIDSQASEIAALNLKIANSIPTVFSKLERQIASIAPGTLANSGTVGNTATSAQTLPGNNYASRSIIPAGAYADKYWSNSLGVFPNLRRFKQMKSFLFPSAADSANSQAVESDFDKKDAIGGPTFNPGAQFYFAENMFRLWDRNAGVWEPTGVTMPRYAYATWVDLELNFHHDDSMIYYDGVSLDGKPLLIPATSYVAPVLDKEGPHMRDGFQLDGPKTGAAYTVLIDNFTLIGWPA